MPTPRTRARRPVPVSPALQQLGERVRSARTAAGLTQAALGAPHFTRAYVSALELGKIRPAMKSLEFIAGRLGKPVSYFLEHEEERRRLREREVDMNAAEALLSRPTAGQALQRARDLLDNASTPSEICRLRLIAGTALLHLVRGGEALQDLVIAERIATQLGDTATYRKIQYQLALAFRSTGNPKRARQMLESLLDDLERTAVVDRPFKLKVIKDLGGICMELGDVEVANSYFLMALEWAKDMGDISGLITIYNGLGYAHRALGDLDAAAGYLQKALASAELANDLTASVVMHNALAVLAADRGHLSAAHTHADKAIEIARVVGLQSWVAYCFNTKAECLLKAGDFEAAKIQATEALELATKTDNERARAGSAVVLADIAVSQADLDEAERRFHDAAGIYKKLDATAELGEVLMRLSSTARARGDDRVAQAYAAQAYEVRRTRSTLVERQS